MRFARARVLAVAAAAVAAVAGAQAPAAQALTAGAANRAVAASPGIHLPYTDPNQAGWLTLCGTNLLPLTHGSIHAVPFVWRVVSSVPALEGYFIKGAKATMYAYQPRPYTPAGAWSGTIMGAASFYSNPAHPMAQFTPIDEPLTQMTLAYPPIWHHLIELRLYLSAPNTSPLTTHYAAADIQVSGNTWQLAAGGHASCTAGSAVSEEVVVGMPGARGRPKHPQLGSRDGGGSSGAGGGGPAAMSGSPVGGVAIAGIVVAALLVVAAIFSGLWWRRRRAAAG